MDVLLFSTPLGYVVGVLILYVDDTTTFWCMSRDSLFITYGVLTL